MNKFTKINIAPFRYDIVGSFLRPQELKKARADYSKNEINYFELNKIENECIKKLVEKELEAGLKSVTDGEFRRSYWHLDFMWGFEGIEHNMLEQGYIFHDEETRKDSARVNGKIKFKSHPFIEHFKFLRDVVNGRAIARQTIPAPAQLYMELKRGENINSLNNIYPNEKELYEDIVNAYGDFISALHSEGCRNLQLDDCTWGMFCDETYRKSVNNVEELKEIALNLNNRVIANTPKDIVVNSHVCRGNYHSTWASSGGYSYVSKTLFAKENVHGYYLEFDDERSGGFEPLKEVSENKIVVLGLITSKRAKLEEKSFIIKRINEASKYIPLDRLCLSPQCGFASTEEGNILTEEEQWKKIALVKEIAEEVWG